MTKDELILKGKHKVRGNSDLMLIYINLFKDQFGYKPNCAGCTFDNDWGKFTSSNKRIGKVIINSEITFELRKLTSEIVHYRIEGDRRIYRSYVNRMTEEYALAFLTYGTPEQIQERKKLFKVLPNGAK